MATKENKRRVKEWVEALEQRVHCGSAIRTAEIESAHNFLRQNDFSPASDYFNRLAQLAKRLQGRALMVSQPQAKRNYGGKAAGTLMQVQSIYDHVILSVCHRGDFNTRAGRVKISHRFNREGRVDFIELKFLQSLNPLLNGELRKLLSVKDFASIQKDWFEAEAHVLRILPQELVFLFENIFQCPKEQVFTWLINIGHGMVADLLQDLQSSRTQFLTPRRSASEPALQDFNRVSGPNLGWTPAAWNSSNGNGNAVCLEPAPGRNGSETAESLPSQRAGAGSRFPDQLPLEGLLQDEVALPILEKVAGLESVVEVDNPEGVLVRYSSKRQD